MVEMQRLLNLGFVGRRIVSVVGRVVVTEGVVAVMEEVLAAIHPSHRGYTAVFAEGGLYLEVEVVQSVTH